MGRRSRKRADGADAMRRGYARGEERNQKIREELVPLAPGERPRSVTVAAIVAAGLGLINLGMLIAGVEVRDKEPPVGGTVLFAVLMFMAAAGMWQARYWAVLGFQALLALTVLIASLSLMTASNLAAVALCLVVIGLGGWLFVKLIRAMARLDMPQREPRPPVV